MSKVYGDFIELVKEISYFKMAEAILEWDQQVNMPEDGVKDRSLQLASLSKLVHARMTSDAIASHLKELQKPEVFDALAPEQQANVREYAWEHHRAAAVPPELVHEIAKHRSEAFQKWAEARGKSDFSIFAPYLQKMVELKKREAEAIGYEDRPYDALMDGFEPGLRSAQVETLFSSLRDKLVPIVSNIIDSGIRPDVSFLTCGYDLEDQKRFNRKLAEDIHYDFKRGRIDEAAHPFTTGSLHDVRITTRYNPDDPRPALFATLHEGGHALYEQGYLEEHFGTPMCEPVSLGIHESQSRMWENLIGRNMPFWKHYYPELQKTFPKQLGDVPLEKYHAAINDVHPSLIRVEADEVTYNLHILLRTEMEMALFSGQLDPMDAPQAWNERMDKFLKVEVPDDANGVLQDIHWSHGLFGYFPTYALGNLYAVQLFDTVQKEIPDLDAKVEVGELLPLLDWLRAKIHTKGRLMRADEMVKDITGEPLNEDHFIAYLNRKFGPLYGF